MHFEPSNPLKPVAITTGNGRKLGIITEAKKYQRHAEIVSRESLYSIALQSGGESFILWQYTRGEMRFQTQSVHHQAANIGTRFNVEEFTLVQLQAPLFKDNFVEVEELSPGEKIGPIFRLIGNQKYSSNSESGLKIDICGFSTTATLNFNFPIDPIIKYTSEDVIYDPFIWWLTKSNTPTVAICGGRVFFDIMIPALS